MTSEPCEAGPPAKKKQPPKDTPAKRGRGKKKQEDSESSEDEVMALDSEQNRKKKSYNCRGRGKSQLLPRDSARNFLIMKTLTTKMNWKRSCITNQQHFSGKTSNRSCLNKRKRLNPLKPMRRPKKRMLRRMKRRLKEKMMRRKLRRRKMSLFSQRRGRKQGRLEESTSQVRSLILLG